MNSHPTSVPESLQITPKDVQKYAESEGWHSANTQSNDSVVLRKWASDPAEFVLPLAVETQLDGKTLDQALILLATSRGTSKDQVIRDILSFRQTPEKNEGKSVALLRSLLLGSDPYERNEVAAGDCEHAYFYKSFVLSTDIVNAIIKSIDCAFHDRFPTMDVSISIEGVTSKWQSKHFSTVEDLKSFFNPKKDRLKRLSLIARRHNSFGCRVEFRDDGIGWSCCVIVEGGAYRERLDLFRDLCTTVSESFQWYSFISNNRGWSNILFAISSLYLIFAVLYVGGQLWRITRMPAQAEIVNPVATPTTSLPAIPLPIHPPNQDFFSSFLHSELVLTMLVVVGILILLVRVRPWLFPKGVFLVGEEINRYKKIQQLRLGTLSTFLMPILVLIVWSLCQWLWHT